MIKGLKQLKDAERLLKLRPQIDEALKSFDDLSKKKPNDLVNLFKLRFINSLLNEANDILTDERHPDASFRIFNEDELPSNSDVVMMISQYSTAMKRFYNDSAILIFGRLKGWVVNGEKIDYVVNDQSNEEYLE